MTRRSLPGADMPRCRAAAAGGQGSPSGAQSAALTAAGMRGLRAASARRRLGMFTLAALAINVGLVAPSIALEIRDLRSGSYVQRPAGCETLGGAPTMTFDGQNFSGHYQMCRTDRLGGSRVRNTCIEAQGPNRPDPSEIDTDPDRTTEETTVTIQSPTSFTLAGKQYRYCGE